MPGTAHSGGRNRKSKAQHKLQGTFQRSRHSVAPKTPAKGCPSKPDYLSDVASAMWDQLATIMDREGRLSVNDGPYLEDASECYAEYVRWRAKARSSPLTQTKVSVDGAGTEHSEEKPHPAQQQYRLASETWRKKLVEGGFTPSSRTRVQVETDAQQDEWAEFDDTGSTH